MDFTAMKRTTKCTFLLSFAAPVYNSLFRLTRMNELEREMILTERAEEAQKVLDGRALAMTIQDGAASLPSYKPPERTPGFELPFNAPCALTPEEARSPSTAPNSQSLQEPSERTPTPKTFQYGFEPPSSAPTSQCAPTPEPFPEAYSPFTAATPLSLQEPDFPLGTFYNQTSTPLFTRSPTPKAYPEASLSDLECCRLSRRLVLRFLKVSWFERYIQGMWVRCPTGNGKYRIFRVKCEHF